MRSARVSKNHVVDRRVHNRHHKLGGQQAIAAGRPMLPQQSFGDSHEVLLSAFKFLVEFG